MPLRVNRHITSHHRKEAREVEVGLNVIDEDIASRLSHTTEHKLIIVLHRLAVDGKLANDFTNGITHNRFSGTSVTLPHLRHKVVLYYHRLSLTRIFPIEQQIADSSNLIDDVLYPVGIFVVRWSARCIVWKYVVRCINQVL